MLLPGNETSRAASASPSRILRKGRPVARISQACARGSILSTVPSSPDPPKSEPVLVEPELGIRYCVASEPATVTNADDLLLPHGIADYTLVQREAGGLLGAGKFSSVHVAFKGKQQFAVKHTPLHSHHPLIASRLLREPTILAQLPTHSNLVKVFETIRTPGHFYLVEEYLAGYITLETFARHFPHEILPDELALFTLCQLIDVVRSALHYPNQVCHRDIKPENIVIHPDTHHVVILDFGLATHYSERQAKLTTCCGSPAFHSPELFLNLKSPPGTVKYWGPEVDIWCIGITLLRCLTGKRCPLGTSHTSTRHMADKVTDALLSIPGQQIRAILAGLLDMNPETRIAFFRNFEFPSSYVRTPTQDSGTSFIEFKTTTFIPAARKHRLNLPLERSLTTSMTRLGINDTSPEVSRARANSVEATREANRLTLTNPDQHTFIRAVSYLKYSLRSAGILYHVWPANHTNLAFSVANTPTRERADPFASTPFERPSHGQCVYLRCVLTLSSPESLLDRLRPNVSPSPLNRSMSTPAKPREARGQRSIRCLAFWMSIASEGLEAGPAVPSKIVVRISDRNAMAAVQAAFGLHSPAMDTTALPELPEHPDGAQPRGRSSLQRPILAKNGLGAGRASLGGPEAHLSRS